MERLASNVVRFTSTLFFCIKGINCIEDIVSKGSCKKTYLHGLCTTLNRDQYFVARKIFGRKAICCSMDECKSRWYEVAGNILCLKACFSTLHWVENNTKKAIGVHYPVWCD